MHLLGYVLISITTPITTYQVHNYDEVIYLNQKPEAY